MSDLIFKPATRQGVKPIIGLYAESGCGKTYSALLLARGIAGPKGRIAMIDTESGRGQIYADVIDGGYDCLELAAPFSPPAYIEAIQCAENARYDVLIVDSASHEWEGIGGVLDMAGEKEAAGGKGLSIWKDPKMAHAKFLLKLLQSPLIVIVCLRAKFKSRQTKHNGKTEIVKDDHVTPIQAEDFIFEMTAHAEILPDHSIILTKCSHPKLRECFPPDKTIPLSISAGEAIAKWANSKPTEKPSEPAKSVQSPEQKEAVKKLWEDAKSHFATKSDFQGFLRSEGLIDNDELLSDNSAERIAFLHETLKKKWAGQ